MCVKIYAHDGIYCIQCSTCKLELFIKCAILLPERSYMAHSVEACTPFLDHHLTKYIDSLPPSVELAYTLIKVIGR